MSDIFRSRRGKEAAVLFVLLLAAFAVDFEPTGLVIIEGSGPVLSASIEVLPEYKVMARGPYLRYNIMFKNLDTEERRDIIISVSAVNEESGKREAFLQETVAIETTLSITRALYLPAGAPEGNYELRMEVEYNGNTAKAADTFAIIETAEPAQQPGDGLIEVLIVAVIAAAVIIFLIEHRHIERIHRIHHRRR